MNLPNRKVVTLADFEPPKLSDFDPARRQVAEIERAVRRLASAMERTNAAFARLERRHRR